MIEDSPKKNPAFRAIGDSSLIDVRRHIAAPAPPGGSLGEYIPFCLGPRSPMLLKIAQGWEDVRACPQEEIIYIISSFDKIRAHHLHYFFTDGHARSNTSRSFTHEKDFDRLDWDAIMSRNWANDQGDLRRKEKKQSELLVKNHVPVTCFEAIGVYNETAKTQVNHILQAAGVALPVHVSPSKLYYDHL